MEIRKVCSLKKLSLGGCRGDRVALSGNTPLGYMAGLALCLELLGGSQAFVVDVEAGGRLRASSSRGGRKVLERSLHNDEAEATKSKQCSAQVKYQTVRPCSLSKCAVRCGAICCAVVLEGELRRGRGVASNGHGGGGESKRGVRRARRMRKSDEGASRAAERLII